VPLAETRDLFASMGYKPALAETEKLLAETVARRRRPQTARSGVRGETSAVARRRVLRPRHELPPRSPAHVRAQRRPEVRDRAARDLTRV